MAGRVSVVRSGAVLCTSRISRSQRKRTQQDRHSKRGDAARRRNNTTGRIETPRVARQVVRHRERSLPSRPVRAIGSATVSTPRPTCSRMTTADGRSPGSRVTTLRRLPGTREPSGMMTEDSPLTVAGAAAALGNCLPSPRSLLIPEGEPSRRCYEADRPGVNNKNFSWRHGGPITTRFARFQNSSSRRPSPGIFVHDLVLPQRVPVGRGVDGDHRLAEPHLGGGGEPHHAEVGADLDDGIDVAAVAVRARSACRAADRAAPRRSPSSSCIRDRCRAPPRSRNR